MMSVLIKIGLVLPLLLVIISPTQSRTPHYRWQTCTCKVPRRAGLQQRSAGGTTWRECVCHTKRAFRAEYQPRVVAPDKLESIGSYDNKQEYEQDWDDEAAGKKALMRGGRRDFLSWLICGLGFCPMENGK